MTGDFTCIECGGEYFDARFTRTSRGPECCACSGSPIAVERVDPQAISMYRDLRPMASGVHVNRASAVAAASPMTGR